MKQLSDHLFWVKDTCSVYGISADGGTLLIDCGTHFLSDNESLARLPRVERVLLTHFHRDQCATAASWARHGARVVMPFAEQRHLQEADLQRAAYDIHDNYDSYYPCFSPLDDLSSSDAAVDYETLNWRDHAFRVIPLPGHTFGSVGYVFEIDGQRILACGDLLASAGTIRDYFWTQWRYMDFQGHLNLLESLETVSKLDLDLILPGHGPPFKPDNQALARLRSQLTEIWELFRATSYEPFRPTFRRLSPHVWEISNVQACPYIVTDDDGHGLFIDCGYTSQAPIGGGPHRFVDRLTEWLEPELGLREVEYFLPTHYHDDHLAGYPALRARYGTSVVASTRVADILRHPERYDMPCAVPFGIELEKTVALGEPFEWRGTRFFIEPHPGQTLYDQHIRFDIDGRRWLAIGDAISGIPFKEERDYIHSFIPKNRTPLSEYASIPRRIASTRPDVLLTGHGGAVDFDGALFGRWNDWMDRWQELFTSVTDRPHPNLAMDPRWVEFYPYKLRVGPGETHTFHLWVTKHEPVARQCEMEIRSVAGVAVQPDRWDILVQPDAKAVCEIQVRFPDTFATHSLPILADVTWGGEQLGEIAEAIAYW